MSEFGFGLVEEGKRGGHITIFLPDEIQQNIADNMGGDFPKDLAFAEEQGCVLRKPGDSGDEFTLKFNVANRKRAKEKKRRLVGITAQLAVGAVNFGPSVLDDDKVPIDGYIGTESVAVGRRVMMLDVLKPAAEDDRVQQLATEWMGRIAHDIGYTTGSERHMVGAVYAGYTSYGGAILETMPMISCGLCTDGALFDPEDERLELSQTNLYSIEQQMICLGGAIAIAYADEMLQGGSSG